MNPDAEVSNLEPTQPTSAADLTLRKDIEILLKSDSVWFTLIVNANKDISTSAKHSITQEINSEADFNAYCRAKNYDVQRVKAQMLTDVAVLENIYTKYNIEGEEKLKRFNELYTQMFVDRILKQTIDYKKAYTGNQNRVARLANETCLHQLAVTWNTNNANYRLNAYACSTIPGPIAPVCVYLAGVARDRQQEDAVAAYFECAQGETTDELKKPE